MNKKAVDFKILLWIAFSIVLLLVLAWGVTKAGILSNLSFAKLAEKIFPFG